jgi:hypothetical protein
MAHITDIKPLTFKGCKALTALAFSKAIEGTITSAPNAFEDASMGFANAGYLVSETGKVTLTVTYAHADGTQAHEPKTVSVALGLPAEIDSPTIEGFTPSVAKVTVEKMNSDETKLVTYSPVVVESQPQASEPTPDTKPDDGPSIGTIIAIVIFAIVIVGVIVFAVFTIRSDKKAKATANQPIRKNDKDSKKKK